MNDFECYELKIDDEFKNLIPPLSADEYQQLKQNIIQEGCREAIITWNGYIIDGHNRYKICSQIGISFQVYSLNLHSREEVIAWICTNQLGRRNISGETRKYLIGKRYEAEKVIGTANAVGSNQYVRKVDKSKKWVHPNSNRTLQKTAMRLGSEYHISHATVNKYAIYAHALDMLGKKEPEIVPKILSGRIKLSHENLIELSKLPNADVKRLSQLISNSAADFVGYSGTRSELQGSIMSGKESKQSNLQIPSGSIKNMPAYDPDAEISSLALTIPSWVSSIDRTRSTANLSIVSSNAREKLEKQLAVLKKTIEDTLTAIKEENHNG